MSDKLVKTFLKACSYHQIINYQNITQIPGISIYLTP